MKVLIGEVSSYKAIAISRFIKQNYPNYAIYTYDSRGFTKTFKTKYSDKHFLISDDHFEKELQNIISQEKIDVFFPVKNDSLTRIWSNKKAYGTSLDYLGSIEKYHILNDKDALHDLAEKLGVKVPKKYKTLSEASIPFIVKPTNLSSAKGVKYIFNEIDRPKNIAPENMIIQEFVKGRGVGYSFYCKEGNILGGYGHLRLAEYPVSGGSSTYRESYKDERMEQVANTIVSNLKYTGFAMFEFKLTDDNQLYLLEVNPRIWGSVHQGLANGINYFEDMLGASSKSFSSIKNVKTYVAPLLHLSLFKYALKFNFKPLVTFAKNAFSNKSDVGFFRDFGGYCSTILRKILE